VEKVFGVGHRGGVREEGRGGPWLSAKRNSAGPGFRLEISVGGVLEIPAGQGRWGGVVKEWGGWVRPGWGSQGK